MTHRNNIYILFLWYHYDYFKHDFTQITLQHPYPYYS
jgi:hypothetical protein